MSTDNPMSNPAQAARYAALAYSTNDLLGAAPDYESVIAILLLDSDGRELVIRARSEWGDIVPEIHREDIGSVLTDFNLRSGSDPLHLFTQAANLRVGPIATVALAPTVRTYLTDGH